MADWIGERVQRAAKKADQAATTIDTPIDVEAQVVLNADLLSDIRNTAKIQWVIKNGERYDAESMQEEWPQQKPLPPFLWRERTVSRTTDLPQR